MIKFDILKMSRYLDKTLEPKYHLYKKHPDGGCYFSAYHYGNKSVYHVMPNFHCIIRRLLKRYIKQCGKSIGDNKVYIGMERM